MEGHFKNNTNPSTDCDYSENFQAANSSLPSINKEKTIILMKQLKATALVFVACIIGLFVGQKLPPSRTDIFLQKYRPTLNAIAAEEIKPKLFEVDKNAVATEEVKKELVKDKNEIKTKFQNLEAQREKSRLVFRPRFTARIEINPSDVIATYFAHSDRETYYQLIQDPEESRNMNQAAFSAKERALRAQKSAVDAAAIATEAAMMVYDGAEKIRSKVGIRDEADAQLLPALENIVGSTSQAFKAAERAKELNQLVNEQAVNLANYNRRSTFCAVPGEPLGFWEKLLKPIRFCFEITWGSGKN